MDGDGDADADGDEVNLKQEETRKESMVVGEHLSKSQLQEIQKIFETVPR